LMCCSTRSKSADVGILNKAFLPPFHEANAPGRCGVPPAPAKSRAMVKAR
jgi:hypothetical protein